MNPEPGGGTNGEPRPARHPAADDPVLVVHVLSGASHCPPEVRRLIESLAAVTATELVSDLAGGAALTDRVTALARLHTIIDAELGRTIAAAVTADALPHSPVTHLERSAAWSRAGASRTVTATRFAARHREIGQMWRRGAVSTEVVAALARGLQQLPFDIEQQIVAAVTPELKRMSVAEVKELVSRALDLLPSQDRDAAEQHDYDRRGVWWTTHGGMTMIKADLPDVDGTAVTAALTALAESLRVEGDGLTSGQRRADALTTIVNSAAAHGDLPASAAGLPVAATITIGAAEADRVAGGASRETVTDLTALVRNGADPARLAVTPTHGDNATLGDAAARFALCAGTWTGALVDDRGRRSFPISQALGRTRSQPLALGRSTRLASTGQRIALALRDGGCILCDRPAGECQTHHVTPWSEGGTTDVDEMCLLCWSHHRQVDLGRWKILRNSDPGPGAPYWTVAPVPRHQWRQARHTAA